MIIVCDDAKTAIAYFNLVKRAVKDKLTLTIVRNPSDRATPAEVVDHAKKQRETLQQERSHDVHDQTLVWALIDLEQDEERRRRGYEARKVAAKVGVSVVLSDPCYEVWTLLHLVDTGESFADCDEVIARVEKEWMKKFGQPFGSKAQADYSKIIPLRKEAAARAKSHNETSPKDPSWTEVYLITDEIDRRLNPPPVGKDQNQDE